MNYHGDFTLWVFLALKEGRKYVDEVRTFVEEKYQNTMTCEEQSLYRVLRKFEYLEVLSHELRKGNKRTGQEIQLSDRSRPPIGQSFRAAEHPHLFF